MNPNKRAPSPDSHSKVKKPKFQGGLQALFNNNDIYQTFAKYTQPVIADVSRVVLFIFVNGSHRVYAMDWNDKDNVRVWEVLGTSNMFITTKLPPDDSPTSQLQTVIGEWNDDQPQIRYRTFCLKDAPRGPIQKMCDALLRTIPYGDLPTIEWEIREMTLPQSKPSVVDKVSIVSGKMVVKTIATFVSQGVFAVEVCLSTDDSNISLSIRTTMDGIQLVLHRLNFIADEIHQPTFDDLQDGNMTPRCMKMSELCTQLARHVLNEGTFYLSSLPLTGVYSTHTKNHDTVISEWVNEMTRRKGW